MKIAKQYEELNKIRSVVDEKLLKTDFAAVSELIRFMSRDDMFEKLRLKDTQLGILHTISRIWLEEKTRLAPYGIEQDIFNGVNSLELAERKYRLIQFGIFRIENGLSDDAIDEYIDSVIELGVSGVALAMIIREESKFRADNAIKLSRYLRNKNAYVDALILLETAASLSYACDDIYMELADMYLEANCLDKAYGILNKIEHKDQNIEDILVELAGILNGENNG